MGKSQSKVNKDVAGILKQKARIGGGNPVSTLCAAADLDGQSGRKQVMTALGRLEKDGRIAVTRNGSGMIVEIAHCQPRLHVDRTELSVQAKRERTFAKGVPAYLTDDMCSAVEVRHGRPQSKDSKAESSTGQGEKRQSFLSREEMLTLALNTLQEAANEDGSLVASSTDLLIKDALGISRYEARGLNKILRDLGLRTSPRGRAGAHTAHWVSLEVTEITREMLERPLAPKFNDASTEEKLAEIITDLERKLAEYAANAESAAKLVEVVSELEQQCDAQKVALAEATEEIDRQRLEVESLSGERDKLQGEVERLRSEQVAKANPSPAVASVLQRYGK